MSSADEEDGVLTDEEEVRHSNQSIPGRDDEFTDGDERSSAGTRTRYSVFTIFENLGEYDTRRSYRMPSKVFFALHRLLFPFSRYTCCPPPESTKNERNEARNGPIPSTTRLAVALRFFAGGAVCDIAAKHGVSQKEVYQCVWTVVDAINQCQCDALQIRFPTDHDEQRRLACGFNAGSDAGFASCIAAVDGLLIWIERPSKSECKLAHCGPKTFMCERNDKFGLNMMGTVDFLGRFLDVEIRHPGFTSDYLAFATSHLKALLEKPGFLAPGLVIFGDNAYENSPYLVTPYKNVRRGTTQDAFNYYHSQLRIRVEQAFGKLVHRWGILRRPISRSIGIRKTGAMFMALCRLHNFCINVGALITPEPLEADQAIVARYNGIEFRATEINDYEPTGLLHGGEHFDDANRGFRRSESQRQRRGAGVLPRRILHAYIVNLGLQRPADDGN